MTGLTHQDAPTHDEPEVRAAVDKTKPATAGAVDQLQLLASVQLLTALGSLSLAMLVLAPVVGAPVMTLVYVIEPSWGGAVAAGAGLFAAVIADWALWLFYRRAARLGGDVNPVELSALSVRGRRLDIELKALDERVVAAALAPEGGKLSRSHEAVEAVKTAITARDESCHQMSELDDLLAKKDASWLTGAAFLTGWRRLHRAEEAFLMCGPLSQVIPGALHDEMRLLDSEIPSSDRWLGKLRAAILDLSPAGARYLTQQAPVRTEHGAADKVPVDPLEARATLRLVRNAINEFRDSSYQGLVRLRDRLVKTLALAALAGYVLLTLVVVHGSSATLVLSAALFFLFGALVGGIYQLQLISQTGSQVEDFGLTTARVLASPVLSGTAAVLGVVIAAILGVTVAGMTLGPPSSGALHLPAWQDVFSWNHDPAGFLAAALFGLVPGRLVDLLQTEAGTLRDRISSSEASGKSR
jgi:hypothetical protein